MKCQGLINKDRNKNAAKIIGFDRIHSSTSHEKKRNNLPKDILVYKLVFATEILQRNQKAN